MELRTLFTPAHAPISAKLGPQVRHGVWIVEQKLPIQFFNELQSTLGPFDYAQVPAGVTFNSHTMLAMDMDSTMISIECIDEIADFCGKKAEVSAITEATMRGEIASFEESLRRRVGLLVGVDADVLHRVYDERLKLNPGAEKLIARAKEAGMKTLLVSGGFTFFTERLKARLGLDAAFSNELDIVDGKLTGKVLGDVLDAGKKARHTHEMAERFGIDTTQAIALGDGSNDLLMMASCGMSAGFHAKPVVRSAANVVINAGGLDQLCALLNT